MSTFEGNPHYKSYDLDGFELRYLKANRDIFFAKSPEAAAITEAIQTEVPRADMLAMEYFDPEIRQDALFTAWEMLRYPVTSNLAGRYQKQVLCVDPAYESQFAVDARVIPFGTAIAGGLTIAATAYFRPEGPISRRRALGRGLRYGVGALGLLLGGSVEAGEVQTGYRFMNQNRTDLVSEGGLRRTVIMKNLFKYAKQALANGISNALAVYPDWLEGALDLYVNNRGLLESDYGRYAVIKDIPRFSHYFGARLYTPQVVGNGVQWNRSFLPL